MLCTVHAMYFEHVCQQGFCTAGELCTVRQDPYAVMRGFMSKQEKRLPLKKAVAMTLGREACDLALINANVVDVFGRTVLEDRTVLVAGGQILAVVPSAKCPSPNAKEIFDCRHRYLTPGLTDAHVHIESTLLTPENFARAVLPCGTTCVIADPHEIANVSGLRGIEYMLDASEGLPVHIMLAMPSCVPCTPFEDAGAELDASAIARLMGHERICALGEVMNYPGLLAGDDDLLAKVEKAEELGKVADGHCPSLSGLDLQAYAGCGIRADHETTEPDLVRERIEAGMYVFIREGSAAQGLEQMLPAVTSDNAGRFCFCTDDLHAEDLLHSGHINSILAKAVSLGLPAATAVAMATLNPAQCFGLKHRGAVAPGYRADLVLMEDLVDFKPCRVWSDGACVADGDTICGFREPVAVPEEILHSMHVAELAPDCLKLPVPSGKARVISINPYSLVTDSVIMDVITDEEGNLATRQNTDLCKIAVIERHKGLNHIGLGILKGYFYSGQLLGGAVATSISHDSHNIVVAGRTDEGMLLAARTVIEMGGGLCMVRDGKVVSSLRLPVAGLMSQEGAEFVAKGLQVLDSIARQCRCCEGVTPLTTLAFMALCVIPSLKVNTRGLFDVNAFKFVSVDAGNA